MDTISGSIPGLIGADELIESKFINSDRDLFSYLKKDLRNQLLKMPEIEKNHLLKKLDDIREKKEAIKDLGFEILNKNYVH